MVFENALLPISEKFNFDKHLGANTLSLERRELTTLQINMGKLCNQVCRHCHVDAGPKRREQMDGRTVEQVLKLLQASPQIKTLDITGGAPEMNVHFRGLVEEAKALEIHVMDRCNLTVLLEPDQQDLVAFLKEHQVEIVASLPCYLKENVEKQRGRGVFEKSIQALRLLNQEGYGKENSGLFLNLVYNPIGDVLPPAQASLEGAYKQELKNTFQVEFNKLFTITNMPINRFAHQLRREEKLENYMELLVQAFNPGTIDELMCRNILSVSWEGDLFDCDFNQMLNMKVLGHQQNIWDIASFDDYCEKRIAVGGHCFGCTAGAGSSCGGALA